MPEIDKEKYFYDFLNRCIPLLTEEGINKLRLSTVAIAGCGGAGGASAITLARMGMGNFKLADPGLFDEPDTNRQWACNVSNLGRNKTDSYEEMLLNINPGIKVKKYSEGLTEQNLTDFLEGADLLIDCLDIAVSVQLRLKMYQQGRKNGIYCLVAPILSFGTMFFCASPDGMPMDRVVELIDEGGNKSKFPPILREVFMPEHLDIIESRIATHKIPSVAVSSILAASVLATESTMILLGKIIPGARKPLCLPKVLAMDLFRLSFYVVDIGSIL